MIVNRYLWRHPGTWQNIQRHALSSTWEKDRNRVLRTAHRRPEEISGRARRIGVVAVALTVAAVAVSCGGPQAPGAVGSGTVTNGSRTVAVPSPTAVDPTPTTAVPSTATPTSTTATTASTPGSVEAAEVRVGAEVLADVGFEPLVGRRVGLITNEASTVRGRPLLDVLAAVPGIELVAVFAPEHGVRADRPAGELLDDGVDPATGVPIVSLYGSADRRAPSADVLATIDVLVFDLQDAGGRFYTYITTMGLAMQAAAAAGIPFVVLDRPNPAGGRYVDGFVRDAGAASFVGPYPIPAAHGLTVGEVASAIRGEAWLDGLDDLDLQVVAMHGWDRDLAWEGTGRPWVAPSPNLPTAAAAEAYLGTVLFEATTLSVGRGTADVFTVVGAPGLDAPAVTAALEARALPGVRFETVAFVPTAGPGAPTPRHEGVVSHGVQIVVIGEGFRPVEVGVHLLTAIRDHGLAEGSTMIDQPQLFDQLAGTVDLRRSILDGAAAEDIIANWQADLIAFDDLRRPYLLYPG